MRARNIKPGFFKNADLAELPFETRILFQGLWCLADRKGRMDDRPKQIKGEVFPYDNLDCDAMLNQLQQHGFVFRYEKNSKRYIQIANFEKHQYPHIRESDSTIPAPDKHSINTSPARLNPDVLNPESPILNPESTPLADPQPKPLGNPPLKIHPWFIGLELYEIDRRLNAKIWLVDKSWMQTYTAVSIETEIKKAHAWELANHKKTDRVKFLNNWLSRAQDKPRGGGFGGDKTITFRKEGGYIGHEGNPEAYANLAEKQPTQQEFEERMRRHKDARKHEAERTDTVAAPGVAEHKTE